MNRPSAIPDHALPRGARSPRLMALYSSLVITTIGTIAAWAVGTHGDFPLNDAWSYAYSAKQLCETGQLDYTRWAGTSLVLQLWYAAALCKSFGFSFPLLRISSVVLGIVAVAGYYRLLRETRIRRYSAILATALLAFNPLFFNLSFTFMTEVPFTTLLIFSAYFYARGFRRDSTRLLLIGSVFAAASILIRQNGAFLVMAGVFTMLLQFLRPISERIKASFAIAALPFAVFVGFHVWLFFVEGAPPGTQNKLSEIFDISILGSANIGFKSMAYVGLFAFPLALASARDDLQTNPRRVIGALVLMVALAGFVFWWERSLMFYLSPVLYNFGVGAPTLRDVLFLDQAAPTARGPWFEFALTSAAVLGSASVIAVWSRVFRRRLGVVPLFFTLAGILLFVGSLLHTRYYYDRYVLPILPFAFAAMAANHRKTASTYLPLAAALAVAWFSFAGTHDYLEWNRARYRLLDQLTAKNIRPQQIDGGLEYNGWHVAPELDTWPSDEDSRRGQDEKKKSWWWVVEDNYQILFSKPEKGDALETETYDRWLLPGEGRIFAIKK